MVPIITIFDPNLQGWFRLGRQSIPQSPVMLFLRDQVSANEENDTIIMNKSIDSLYSKLRVGKISVSFQHSIILPVLNYFQNQIISSSNGWKSIATLFQYLIDQKVEIESSNQLEYLETLQKLLEAFVNRIHFNDNNGRNWIQSGFRSILDLKMGKISSVNRADIIPQSILNTITVTFTPPEKHVKDLPMAARSSRFRLTFANLNNWIESLASKESLIVGLDQALPLLIIHYSKETLKPLYSHVYSIYQQLDYAREIDLKKVNSASWLAIKHFINMDSSHFDLPTWKDAFVQTIQTTELIIPQPISWNYRILRVLCALNSRISISPDLSVRLTNRFLLKYIEFGCFTLSQSSDDIPSPINAVLRKILEFSYPQVDGVQEYIIKLIKDGHSYLPSVLVNHSKSLFYPTPSTFLREFQLIKKGYLASSLLLNIQKFASIEYIEELNQILFERSLRLNVPILVLHIFTLNSNLIHEHQLSLVVLKISKNLLYQAFRVGGKLTKMLRMMAFIYTSVEYYSPFYQVLDHDSVLNVFNSDYDISEIVLENEWNRLLECVGSIQRVTLVFE